MKSAASAKCCPGHTLGMPKPRLVSMHEAITIRIEQIDDVGLPAPKTEYYIRGIPSVDVQVPSRV